MNDRGWSEPRLFSKRDVRILTAMAETLVPLDDPEVPLGRVDLIARLEEVFLDEDPLLRRLTRLGLWCLELSPLFSGLGPRRFSGLSPEGRRTCLERWSSSNNWRVRSGFGALRSLILITLYDDPSVAATLGYRP